MALIPNRYLEHFIDMTLVAPDLCWNEKVPPRYTLKVGQEIQHILTLFNDALTADTILKLNTLANALIENQDDSADALGSPKKDTHPLALLASTSPTFVALHPGNSRILDPTVMQLERLGRLALLTHISSATPTLNASRLDAIQSFCRTLPYTETCSGVGPASPEYETFTDTFVILSASRDWFGLKQSAKAFNQNPPPELKKFAIQAERLAYIADALLQIGLTTKPKAAPRPKTNKKTVQNTFYPPGLSQSPHSPKYFVIPARNDLPSIIIEQVKNDERIAASNKNALETLAIRGSSLRLTSLWADSSYEALLPSEARECIKWLFEYQPANKYDEAAKFLWLIVGASMQRFDNLLVAFCRKELGIPDPIPDITVSSEAAGYLTLEFDIINSDTFDSVPPAHEDEFAPSSQRISYIATLPQDGLKALYDIKSWLFPNNQLCLESLKALKIAKKSIRRKIRQQASSRFTDNAFRATLFQQIFSDTGDIALLQMIAGDLSGFSDAALHYIAFEQKYIQNAIDSARSKLYDGYFPSCEHLTKSTLIGAPTSTFNTETFRTACTQLAAKSPKTLPAKFTSITELIETNNAQTDHLGWLLLTTTGSRNQKDSSELTLAQICLDLCTILLKDKGSDPAIFRRLAVLPDYVVGEISLRIHFLRKIVDYCKRHPQHASLCTNASSALDGESPLLFHLTIDTAQEVKSAPWVGRLLLKKTLGEKIPGDIFRHHMATNMRKYCAPAALIEIQLGHTIGYPVFGEESVVDIPTLVKDMKPHLNHFLQRCGYNTNNVFKLPVNAPYTGHHISRWPNLAKNIAQIRQDDARRMKSIKRAINQTGSGTDLNEIIKEEIRSNLHLNEKDEFPRQHTLKEENAKEIYRAVLSRVADSPASIKTATIKLAVKLRQLRTAFAWDVTIPPSLFWSTREPIPLTEYHFNAWSSLRCLRNDFLKISPPTPLSQDYTSLLLLIFGAAYTWDESTEITHRSHDALSTPNNNALIIPIGTSTSESRTISGLPMLALASYNSNSGRKNLASPSFNSVMEYIPIAWQQSTPEKTLAAIETLVKLSAYVQLPPILASVKTGTLVNRSMDAQRLIEFLSDTGSNHHYEAVEITDKTLFTEMTQAASIRACKKANKESIERLQLAIKDPYQFGINSSLPPWVGTPHNDRAAQAVKVLLDSEPGTQVVTLLAVWASILLGPHACFNRNGYLQTETVQRYIKVASSVLLPALNGIDIYSINEDELTAIIESSMRKTFVKHEVYQYASERISRFFSDVSPICDIPTANFSTYSPRNSNESIPENGVFTRPEILHAKNALLSWSESGSTMGKIARPLRDAAFFLETMHAAGTRRQEALGLAKKDYLQYRDEAFLRVHPNRARGVKTLASTRTIYVPNHQLPPIFKEESNGTYIFSSLTSGQGYIALQAMTQALKYASGHDNARGHWIRRTKVCQVWPDAMRAVHTLERIKRVSFVVSQIGHATLKSTASHYLANLDYFAATEYSYPIKLAPRKFIVALTNDKIRNPTSQIQYSEKTNKPIDAIFLSAVGYSASTIKFDKGIPQPPSFLSTHHFRPNMIIDVFLFALHHDRQQNVTLGKVPYHQISLVLSSIEKSQVITDLRIISTAKVESIQSALQEHIPWDNFKHQRSHVSKKMLQQWSANLKPIATELIFNAAKTLRSLISGVKIGGDSTRWVFANESELTIAQESLTSLNAPAILRPTDNDRSTATLEVSMPLSKQSKSASIKSIIIIISVLAIM